MAWNEVLSLRNQRSRSYSDSDDPRKRMWSGVLATLHYEDGVDSDKFDVEVDFAPERIDNLQFDGWRVTKAGWHLFLGKDLENHGDEDGWLGVGGRQGQNQLKFRLEKAGYLHWPTRAFDNVGGTPDYDRANLSQEIGHLTIGPNDDEVKAGLSIDWSYLWTTPGGGELSIQWRPAGEGLKERIVVNQAAREWISINRPPSTPPDETWFGFIFRLDLSDIPKWVKRNAGTALDPDGDFDDADDDPIQLEDALGRLLAFMPISEAWVEPRDDDVVSLQKRIWKDDDGHYYLLVGARVDRLNGLPDGDIIFDPTFTTQPDPDAGKDNYMKEQTPNSNRGTTQTLDVDATSGNARRVLIEFDCSSVAGDATCISATLSLWSEGSLGTLTHTLYELQSGRAGWTESGSHWNSYATGNSWTTAGCSSAVSDFVDTAIGTIAYPDLSVDTEAQGALTPAVVEKWFGDPNENYGLLIKCLGDDGNRDWHSSDADGGDVGYRPKLTVVWESVAFVPGRVIVDRRRPLVKM